MIPVVAGSNPVSHPISALFFLSTGAGLNRLPTASLMESLESRIAYKFRNSLLLAEALTHPSLAYESQKPHFDNQRLEFLGDSVIQLVLTQALFETFPDFSEGRLTKLRARVVSKGGLHELAVKIDLGQYVMLGKGEESTGGRDRASTLADAFEALCGAIYLDSDLARVKAVVLEIAGDMLQKLADAPEEKNPKGQLQEALQSVAPESPCYELVGEEGPDHKKVFKSQVVWRGDILGCGEGTSKKLAEIAAAREALKGEKWKE